ncbi:MAG: hypothetical protein Q4F31_09410 [Eubacteriales bacterium]|nr:hypothetical protein [Eubacteriales bacterium]
MKNDEYISNLVLCPVYRKETRSMIFCCGIQEGSLVHIAFADPAEKMRFRREHCCSEDPSRRCILFPALIYSSGGYGR